jgi:predicted tellurium resistance membrane protein TerC
MIDTLFSLFTLIVLEIVLGIDNLVLLSILTNRLPESQRDKARKWGLTLAWMTRLLLLSVAVWIQKLTKPLFFLFSYPISFRSLFFLIGGVFLIFKAAKEIQLAMKEEEDEVLVTAACKTTFHKIVVQIAVMDIVFSLDSVLTAIGLAREFFIMVVAITCAVAVMLCASAQVSKFIYRYPTVKMLALAFLMLIGVVLIADSLSFHIPKTYIYVAMGFSMAVETLNILKRSRSSK